MFKSHTRRDLLLLALTGSNLFAASDFWNRKSASDWSEDEILQLKTKSPWSKKVRAELAGGRGGGSRGGGESMDRAGSKGTFGGMSGADTNGISAGGGRGGGGRGGGGDSGGGSGGGQSAPSVEVVIRWENAKPLMEATKLKLPPVLDDHYAISVTGLPQQLIMMALNGGGAGEDPAARQKAAYDRLLHSAVLSARGKDPQTADQVVQTTDKQTLIFGFSKGSLPLAAADKDVQFAMKLGIVTLKAKFDPKEMTYKGELSI